MPAIPTDRIPLRNSSINLDISGVAGFFGGDVAVSAMGTVSLYEGRKWLGWYNTPGSYEIAKRYGRLAQHRLWCGLYPGATDNPAELFELDGKVGPRYRGVHSGTDMAPTGHLAYLLYQECKNQPTQTWDGDKTARVTSPIDVTIAYLHHVPEIELATRDRQVYYTNWFSILPILVSIAACIVCGLITDWYCCSMIAFGMVCSGVSCWVMGQGEFTFTHPKPAEGAPVGDGYLMDNEQVIILRGAEGAVNPITRGRFSLKYKSHPHYHDIGVSSVLLTIQFLLQLLLVPQGQILGQVMFLTSLAASWVYNSFLSSLDKESIQRRLLVNNILKQPILLKYRLGTRTTMAVFVMLVLSSSQSMDSHSLRKLLDDILRNDTKAWCHWKKTIVKEICQLSETGREPTFKLPSGGAGFQQTEVQMLEQLYGDAQAAYQAFKAYISVSASAEKEKALREGLVDRDEDPDTTAHSSREELEEKDEVDEDVNEKPERDVEAFSALRYSSEATTEGTGDTLARPESVGGRSRASTHTCSPTPDNWYGGRC